LIMRKVGLSSLLEPYWAWVRLMIE